MSGKSGFNRKTHMISTNDRNIMRELAAKWMEWAAAAVMEERKRSWKAVHDLQAERPVILFETDWIEGYVADSELLCEDPFLRSVERSMRIKLRQAEELGDDIVIEPYYRLGWRMNFSDYGVPVEIHSAVCPQKSIAYSFSFPIATPEDIHKLKPRTFAVDRAESLRRRDCWRTRSATFCPSDSATTIPSSTNSTSASTATWDSPATSSSGSPGRSTGSSATRACSTGSTTPRTRSTG